MSPVSRSFTYAVLPRAVRVGDTRAGEEDSVAVSEIGATGRAPLEMQRPFLGRVVDTSPALPVAVELVVENARDSAVLELVVLVDPYWGDERLEAEVPTSLTQS